MFVSFRQFKWAHHCQCLFATVDLRSRPQSSDSKKKLFEVIGKRENRGLCSFLLVKKKHFLFCGHFIWHWQFVLCSGAACLSFCSPQKLTQTLNLLAWQFACVIHPSSLSFSLSLSLSGHNNSRESDQPNSYCELAKQFYFILFSLSKKRIIFSLFWSFE